MFYHFNSCIPVFQCGWPTLDSRKEDLTVSQTELIDKPVRAMFIADTHLLGSKEGHWFDKLRRFVFFNIQYTNFYQYKIY